jgi:hypothetical protein
MKVIAKKTHGKNLVQNELENSMASLLKLLHFTQAHIETSDRVKSITVKNETHTLTLKPNIP